jgi:hypothetical protein
MTSLAEAAAAAGAGKGAVLQAGVDTISEQQLFTFTLYKRLILPADGYVFWCLASAITPPIVDKPLTLTAPGSLHLSQNVEQEADSTIARQRVIFTAEQQLIEFAAVAEDELYFMTLPNGSLAAFSSQNMRYDTSDLWHYAGVAVLPYEATQIIANPADVLAADRIVSNSMPLWLAMSTVDLPVYPADLAPMNLVPPYVTADIDNTTGLAAAPLLTLDSSQSQLCAETVVFTLWGCRNDQALDFQRALLDNSLPDDASYGVMNVPVPVDRKKPQSDFRIIAQQKTMSLDLNYYQQRTRAIARKLIESAFITITAEG